MGFAARGTRKVLSDVFDFLHDQNFLSALAAIVGPLAFFAAPTEEIEHILFHEDVDVTEAVDLPVYAATDAELAEAA
jgi:hypothetical protein